ncbi:MAG: NAD(P)/FAD-dependent oxidoreductase [Pseudomonadota bacterium]
MADTPHFDVMIIGAGLSGIGAAVHLQRKCPEKSFALLETREAIGGTWDLFRYPGIRSDSDMHTLGYNFKPWTAAKAIADGPSIRAYVNETADEFDIRDHIHFRRRMTKASWSSAAAAWRLEAEDVETGETYSFTCGFLLMCAGYYNYREGHTPDFPGKDAFEGQIIHPQFWPEDLDYSGKKVVVIGSGATAMTLVPAMADAAENVTMLQRSPTYVVSRPDQDWIANAMRKVMPGSWAYGLTRTKNVLMQQVIYKQTRTKPEKVKERLLGLLRDELGPDFDIETHFTPTYNPWDQRLCLVPNSDLFEALKSGRAQVKTDQIEAFDKAGIKLASGERIDADIIVTATGLELVILGEAAFDVDGEPVNFGDTWSYKGVAYSGVPNMISTFGYINASWTLRADLTAEYACRVIERMDALGANTVVPRLRAGEETMPARPWIDDFSAGYMQRVMHRFPKQGDRAPWINPQNYGRDRKMFRKAPIEDGALVFTRNGRRLDAAAELDAVAAE